MTMITLLAIITVIQIIVGVIAANIIDNCEYKYKQLNIISLISSKAGTIRKLNLLSILLLGILWGFVLVKFYAD